MKKIGLSIAIIGLIVVGLVGCSTTKKTVSTKKSSQEKIEQLITKNKKKIELKNKNIENLSSKMNSSFTYVSIASSVKELREDKEITTIQGQVVDWKSLTAFDESPLTILKVSVDKSLTGKNVSKGTTVNVLYRGGYAKYGDITKTLSSKYGATTYAKIAKDETVFWEDSNAPIPRIGDKVILAPISNDYNGKSKEKIQWEKDNSISNNGKTYFESAPELSTWIYNDKTKKYELNNKSGAKDHEEFTNEINKLVK